MKFPCANHHFQLQIPGPHRLLPGAYCKVPLSRAHLCAYDRYLPPSADERIAHRLPPSTHFLPPQRTHNYSPATSHHSTPTPYRLLSIARCPSSTAHHSLPTAFRGSTPIRHAHHASKATHLPQPIYPPIYVNHRSPATADPPFHNSLSIAYYHHHHLHITTNPRPPPPMPTLAHQTIAHCPPPNTHRYLPTSRRLLPTTRRAPTHRSLPTIQLPTTQLPTAHDLPPTINQSAASRHLSGRRTISRALSILPFPTALTAPPAPSPPTPTTSPTSPSPLIPLTHLTVHSRPLTVPQRPSSSLASPLPPH